MKSHCIMLGLTLLEQLLTLAVALALITGSVRQFMAYAPMIERHWVQDDLSALHQALHRYFYQHGCDIRGRFRGKTNPSISQLGLASLTDGRAPWIATYQTELVLIPTILRGKCEAFARIRAQLTPSGVAHRASLISLLPKGEYIAPTQISWQTRLTPNTCLPLNPLSLRRYQA